MNIAGTDDQTLLYLKAYFETSAECATNEETRTEAVAFLKAVSDELLHRKAGEPR
jgi:hypothetical protein